MDHKNSLAIALIFSLLLNFFVPLSSAQENFTADNDNGMPPDEWPLPPPENSPGENSDYPSDVAPPENSIGLSENSPGGPPAGPEGLIGYWNFDEGQGGIVRDESGLGNDGAVYGADWVSWKMGAALEFGGSDYIIVSPDPSLNPAQITVAAWIYPTLFPGAGEANDHFLGKWGSGGYQYIAYLAAGGNGQVRFQIMDGSGRINESRSNVNVPLNDWSHFAATWDGSDIKIYINGAEGTTAVHKQFTGDVRGGSSPLKIGLGNESGFQGRMDGIRMYNHALAPDNILVLYQEGDATPTALTVSPSSFSSSWNESMTLTATLTSGGSPLVDKRIAWSVISGSIVPSSAMTDTSGQVTVIYTAPSISTRNPVAVAAFFPGDSSHRSSIANSYVTLPSLVGYWGFDEGEGNIAYDSSGNGYNGTIYGATWDYCKIGKSLGFGGGYVRVSNSPSLNPQSAITVEAWFRANNVSSNNEPLISKHNDATGNNSYHVGIVNGNFGFLFDDDGSGWATGSQIIVPVANDQWYHGAVTWDGKNWKIYLNGDEKATGTWAGTIYAGAADLYIGTREQLGDFYDGIMDEVRIYNRALGPEEVVRNYQGQQVVDNGLVSWWSFDDGTASDVRGTNHGTIHGAMVLDPAGRVGKAPWFDGIDDTVSMGDNLDFDYADSWTLAAWVKTPDSNHGAVVSKIYNGRVGYDIFVVGTTFEPDAPYFGRVAVHLSHDWNKLIRKYSDNRVDDGEWHHIAYTYDGTCSADGVNIYIDGVPHDGPVRDNLLPGPILNDYPLRVGSREGLHYFRGLIDEVRIYNRVLTAEEILELYWAPEAVVDNTPPSSNVLPFEGDAYWKQIETIGSDSFTVSAVAVDDNSVENIELWYRYSLDNWTDDVVWKKRGWQLYGVDTDNTGGWSWSFVSDNYGYYEFFSVATDAAGNRENEPRIEWVQTTQEDFEAGELENLVIEDNSVRLAPKVIYEDNFDEYEVGTFPSGEWELAFGSLDNRTGIIEDVYVSGGKSFQVLGILGATSVVQRPVPTDVDFLSYELWVRTEGGDHQGIGFFNREAAQWGKYYAFLSFEADGYASFAGAQERIPYEPNRWYKIKAFLDKSAGVASLWIDGQPVWEEVDVSDAHEINAICLVSGHADGKVAKKFYVDDVRLIAGYLPSGVLTSPVHDAGGWTDWGEISWDNTSPPGTEITLQTKTSIDNVTWSDWSDNYTDSAGEAITSPAERYIQYRAILETEDPNLTPELREVRVTWSVADANVRVAEDLVRVAVILAEPKSGAVHAETLQWINEQVSPREYLRRTGDLVTRYFDETSYGALALVIENDDIYDAGGEWYKLGKPQSSYLFFYSARGQWTYSNEFLKDAINAADGDVNYGNYKAVAVVGPCGTYNLFPHYDGADYTMEEVRTDTGETAYNPIFLTEPRGTVFDREPAHELAHAVGKILTGERLPDFYETAGSWGNLDGWDVMGYEEFVHLSSWSKERLGWLEYGYMFYGIDWIEALPTLSYGDAVYRYDHAEWGVLGMGGEISYLLEVRTDNRHYSNYDGDVPGTGLVLYKVEETYNWFGQSTRVNVVGDSPFVKERALWYDPYGDANLVYEAKERDKTTRFWIWDMEADQDTYKMRVGINVAPYGWTEAQEMEQYYDTGAMYESPPWETQWDIYPSADNAAAPDLDLHAYTTDGQHVGVNYETGEYEIQIENTFISGDLFQGSEWISVPSDIEIYFVVSAHDVEEYYEQNPGAERRDGLYGFDTMHTDNARNDYTSPIVGQSIPPGAEVFHEFEVVQNPDGTYSVSAGQGIDLMDLAAWHSAIDNLPDNVFIRNPNQRKNALKEKFEEVFEELDEAQEEIDENELADAKEHYRAAAEKLANDILKKLDADGQADWVSEPTLLDELNAFIGILRYRAGGGED